MSDRPSRTRTPPLPAPLSIEFLNSVARRTPLSVTFSSITMLTLSIKGLRPFKPTSLSSHLPPQRRPKMAKQAASLTNRCYSKTSGKQPDKDVLQKLKKIAALRREFESRDGVEMMNHSIRYTLRLRQQGVEYGTAKANAEKALQLWYASSKLVLGLSETEDLPLRTHQRRLRFVSRLGALLEAAAAQPRPVLRLPERLAVRKCLQAYLKDTRRNRRVFWVVALIAGGLLGKSFHWLWKWFYRTPVDDSDFSKIHKPDPGVE